MGRRQRVTAVVLGVGTLVGGLTTQAGAAGPVEAPPAASTESVVQPAPPGPTPRVAPLAAPNAAKPVAVPLASDSALAGRDTGVAPALVARPNGSSVIATSSPQYVAPRASAAVPAAPSDAALAALRDCESHGNYGAVSAGGQYRGAYQFDQSTWNSVAGRWAPALAGSDPAQASPADQDAMARALYAERGWAPWPTCGSGS